MPPNTLGQTCGRCADKPPPAFVRTEADGGKGLGLIAASAAMMAFAACPLRGHKFRVFQRYFIDYLVSMKYAATFFVAYGNKEQLSAFMRPIVNVAAGGRPASFFHVLTRHTYLWQQENFVLSTFGRVATNNVAGRT